MDLGSDHRGTALDLLAWPALAGLSAALTFELRFSCGVWGKAPGATTDYRWLATSPGFPADDDLAITLNLGAEDRPERSWHWRGWQGRWCAFCTYPSRAIDAFGRRGFSEKQMLIAESDPSLPAAAVALALLPLLRARDDAVWWERAPQSAWVDTRYRLAITAPADGHISVSAHELRATIQSGVSALAAALTEADLAAAYGNLLGDRATLLPSALALSPEAVAALLLPLPRAVADRCAIAGGLVSSRPRWEELERRWNLLVVPDSTRSQPTAGQESLSAAGERALLLGQALLRADPTPLGGSASPTAEANADQRADADSAVRDGAGTSGLPVRDLPLTQPPAEAPVAIKRLWTFAARTDARWIEPDQLIEILDGGPSADAAQRLRAALGAYGSLLLRWIDFVSHHPPPAAQAEHWQVKVDVLTALGLATVSDPEVRAQLRMPDGTRVPPLLYFPVLVPPQTGLATHWDESTGPTEAIRRSLRCRDHSVREPIRAWLERAGLTTPEQADCVPHEQQ
jgi:hypothetical protein